MSDFTVPDCLVLKLQEVEEQTKEKIIDSTVYILYDKKEHCYIVRGKRRCSSSHNSCPYSFECKFANDLVDFLQYLICKSNTVNEVLYNYNNLPYSSNDITFDFLNESDHSDYEISGYNGIKLLRNRLLKNFKMLRNISNY
jgi:hypothetical protein